MATIFTDQASAYDGSGSPSTGSADVDVTFVQTPTDGGHLELWHRPSGSSIGYVKVWDRNHSDSVKYRANGMQYYYKWTPKTSTSTASLEG